MKKKRIYFLYLFLCLLACTFIYLKFLKKVEYTLETVFSKSDGKLIILNKKNNEFDTLLNSKTLDIINQTKPYLKFSKMFVSQTKPKVLFILNTEVTNNIVEEIAKKINKKYSIKEDTYFFKNGWKLSYYKRNLFFYKGRFKSSLIQIPTFDRNADAIEVDLKNNSVVSYYKENKGLKKIYTLLSTQKKYLLIDDAKLFSKYLPSTIETYCFVETNYGLDQGLIENESLLNRILEKGFVTFSYKGNLCLMLDVKFSVDPFKYLNEEIGKREALSGLFKKYTNVFLLPNTPELNNQFYVDWIGDKLVFVENEHIFIDLYENYNQSQCLLKNPKQFDKIYEDLPNEVSYRYVSKNNKVSKSFSSNRMIEKIVMNNNDKYKIFKILINEIIKNVISFDKHDFVFTDKKILRIYDNKIEFSVPYSGNIIGSPQVFRDNDSSWLSFTTNEKLYCVDVDLNSKKGFPIKLKYTPKIPFYFFINNKIKKIIGYTEQGKLSVCNFEGTIEKSFDLKIENVKQNLAFYKDNSWNGIIYGDKRAEIFCLSPASLVSSLEDLDTPIFATSTKNQAFFYVSNNEFIRNDFSGDLKVCAKGRNLKEIKSFNILDIPYVSLLSDKNVVILEADGDIVTKIKHPTKEINNYEIISNEFNDPIICLYSNKKKEIYLYTFDGAKLLNTPLIGDKIFNVNFVNGNIEIFLLKNNELIKHII